MAIGFHLDEFDEYYLGITHKHDEQEKELPPIGAPCHG